METQVLSCDVFVRSPGAGVGVTASSYYTRARGLDLMSIHSQITRSDTNDVSYVRWSGDNGRTWSEPEEHPAFEPRPEGMLRRHPRGGYVDPPTGRYATITTEGILPSDDPLEGMRQWVLVYTVSEDGGHTSLVREQIIHEGDEYDETHHLPGVWRGRNCVMLGDFTCRPLTLDDGTILVPCQISPIGPDGEYYNPGGGLTYTDAAVLHGRWREDKRIAWTLSQRVEGDPARSTRGMVEPTIAVLADGRIMMVMRGSNDTRPQLPGFRWVAFSSDRGHTWSAPEPWTYADGFPFYSPSSCSQLFAHSSGTLFWIGNLCGDNPRGNSPRYPLVVGEVDQDTGLLMEETVSVIDDRGLDDSERLTLSNFYAREDRETGDILLHMTRFFASVPRDWTADANLYRIALDE